MNSLAIKGSVAGVHQLPCPPAQVSAGDTYIVGTEMYVWTGDTDEWQTVGQIGPEGKSAYQVWLANGHTGSQVDFLNSLIGPQGPKDTSVKMRDAYTLTYNGVEVTLWSEHHITELFLDPNNLDMDDLAIFETTYPEDYKAFESLWADLRAKQLAKDELNEWRDKYAKDIRGDNS